MHQIVLLAFVSGLCCPGSWPVAYHKLVQTLNGRAVLMMMRINFHQLLPWKQLARQMIKANFNLLALSQLLNCLCNQKAIQRSLHWWVMESYLSLLLALRRNSLLLFSSFFFFLPSFFFSSFFFFFSLFLLLFFLPLSHLLFLWHFLSWGQSRRHGHQAFPSKKSGKIQKCQDGMASTLSTPSPVKTSDPQVSFPEESQ